MKNKKLSFVFFNVIYYCILMKFFLCTFDIQNLLLLMFTEILMVYAIYNIYLTLSKIESVCVCVGGLTRETIY